MIRLRTKIIFIFALTVGLIMLSYSFASLMLDRKALRAQLDFQGNTLVTVIGRGTKEAVDMDKMSVWGRFIRELTLSNQAIVFISLTTTDGQVIYHSDPQREKQQVENSLRTNGNRKSLTLKSYPYSQFTYSFTSTQNVPYLLTLSLSHQRAITRVSESIRRYVLLTIASIAIAILIGYLLSLPITRPVMHMVKTFTRMSSYDLLHAQPTQVNIRSGDELELLGDAFNDMMHRLGQSLKRNLTQAEKMSIYEHHLEEIVELRTRELNKINKALKIMHGNILEELEMARRIQENLLPSDRHFIHRKEFSVGSKYQAMESLGGDLYDIIRTGRNGYGFLIADVSGHGVAAALITTMAKVSFNDNSGWDISPATVCTNVNKEMCRLIGDLNYFITAFYATLNLESAELRFTNAGHHPAILFHVEDKSTHVLDTRGSILGTLDDSVYEYKSILLSPGDRLLFYTDGVIESRNPREEFYGEKRLMNFIGKNSHLPPKKFVDELFMEIDEFCEGEPLRDDRAMLLVEFVSKIESGNTPHSNVHFAAREEKAPKDNKKHG